jgi:hypothetical protein
VEPRAAVAINLPQGPDGARRFSSERGNKRFKLDLEASLLIPRANTPGTHGRLLVLFGSGSGVKPQRENIFILRERVLRQSRPELRGRFRLVPRAFWNDYAAGGAASSTDTHDPDAGVLAFHAHELYELLRRNRTLVGYELNIEGAALLHNAAGDGESVIRFFQRGNGAADPSTGAASVSATADVPLRAFFDYLDALMRRDGQNVEFGTETPATAAAFGAAVRALQPQHIVRYELGTAHTVPLSFTGAATPLASSAAGAPPPIYYIAGAEASADAITDGDVVGTAIGAIAATDAAYVFLQHPDGRAFLGKGEGIVMMPTRDGCLIVLDRDDITTPSQLCQVKLTGI